MPTLRLEQTDDEHIHKQNRAGGDKCGEGKQIGGPGVEVSNLPFISDLKGQNLGLKDSNPSRSRLTAWPLYPHGL